MPDYKYDVVISFASEQSDIAVAVSLALEAKGVKVYYYPYKQEENIGIDLQQNLSHIYENEGLIVVGIFTEEYFQKKFTKIEFEAIQKRLKRSPKYLIPILLKNQVKPLKLNGLTYFSWNRNPKEFADIVFKRMEEVLKELILSDAEEIALMSKNSLLKIIERLQKFDNVENVELQYQLGLSHYFLNQSQNDIKLSEQYFRKAILLKPSLHQAYFWLSNSIITQKGLHKIKHREIQEPIDFLKKAMLLNPENETYKNYALEIEKNYYQKYGLRSPF